ncbi:MAG: VanW family protein [Propionibacteriaceae bacterium]
MKIAQRPLLCELGPVGYWLSALRLNMQRRVTDSIKPSIQLASTRDTSQSLPTKVYSHRSLILRRLGDVDMTLQEGKARTLKIVAPLIDGIIISPGETFSFWSLIGCPSSKRGFDMGLTIVNGKAVAGVGGGLCQVSNLIHWLALHSPLTVTEHHHHNEFDLFPDFNRQVPFGVGTSVAWSYIDYRLYNTTEHPYQLRMKIDGEYLAAELRSTELPEYSYHIRETESYFYEELDSSNNVTVRRHNSIERKVIDRRTGNKIRVEHLLTNDALTMYDRSLIKADIRKLMQ